MKKNGKRLALCQDEWSLRAARGSAIGGEKKRRGGHDPEFGGESMEKNTCRL